MIDPKYKSVLDAMKKAQEELRKTQNTANSTLPLAA
jgi:hypothetical protein